jgi:TonB-linked SusC/RagA family outer membrane protein
MKKPENSLSGKDSFYSKKTLLIMKLTTFLLTINLLQISAQTYSQSEKVTLKFSNATVKEMFAAVEKQTNYKFLYRDDDLEKISVNIDAIETPLNEVLASTFKESDNSYRILDNNLIVIAPKSEAQSFKVTGNIVDSNTKEPMIGVTVSIKGTSKGTMTDATGKYSIDVDDELTVLVFSYVGYDKQEKLVDKNTTIDVSLVQELTKLDEVVVVGYGVKKKSLVTGAISSVKADDIKTTSSSSVDQAMQGKTAGVMILPQAGGPGSTTNIRIRGVGSNQGSNPIIMVNGMRLNDISSINPSDIESIEVLKDAASAAIYGAEGANGVVLITLKTGKKEKAEVNYDFQYGIQSLRSDAKMMDATQYKQWQQEAGFTTQDRFNANTDWINELFQTAPMQQHHLSFSGGTDKTTYLISGGYLNQDGIIGKESSNYQRYTALANIQTDVKKWLQVGTNVNVMHTSQNGILSNSEYNNVAGGALLMDPLTPVTYDGTPAHIQTLIDGGNEMRKDANGKYYGIGENITGEMINPFLSMDVQHNNTKVDQMSGISFATIKPIEGLSITSRIGVDVSYSINHQWQPRWYGSAESQNTSSFVRDNIRVSNRWVWDNFATYTKQIDDHSVTGMIGYSAQQSHSPNNQANSGNTQNNTYSLTSSPMVAEGDQYATQAGTTNRLGDAVAGYNVESTMASVFGRLSYDFKGKYLFEGSIRRDGASEFPKDAKYGVFPAISGGWVASKEDFLQMDLVSYLKFRASWGQNGSRSNLRGIDDQELWNLVARYPNDQDNFVSGGWIRQNINKDLRWETSQQTDIGFDLRMLKDKLSLTFDYFNRETKDLIALGGPLFSSGNGPASTNLGTVSNKGAEIELGYRNEDGEFKYGASVNVSFLTNKVTEMNVPTPIDGLGVRNRPLTRFELNQPIWYFRGYKTDGILKDNAEATAYNTKYGTTFTAGDLKVVDADGNGQINSNDITKIGDPNPNMIFGGNIYMKYMGFDFNLSFQGTQGNDLYMGWFREDRPGSNKPAYFFEDRWTATNTGASMPKANNTSLYLYNGDKMIADGSYLRIKQLQLGYTIPTAITSKVNISSLRGYISLDDYFTFTAYKGYDPEVGSNDNTLQGLDRGRYPTAAKVVFGVSVNF